MEVNQEYGSMRGSMGESDQGTKRPITKNVGGDFGFRLAYKKQEKDSKKRYEKRKLPDKRGKGGRVADRLFNHEITDTKNPRKEEPSE